MATDPLALVQDPGRPGSARLATRVLRSEIRGGLKRLSRRLGFRKLYEAVPEDWSIPDSDFAVRATAYATELCPEFMVRHCFRSYCFGALLAARNGLTLDREIFFVAAMLHDLGLSEAHADAPGSFEWVGARLAHAFSNTESPERAATIHNSIALHTSVGLAERERPEVAMLHFGTALDLFGARLDEVPTEALESILERHPRGAFKEEFSPCLHHQATSKPESQIAGAVGLGIIARIRERLEQLS